MPIALYQNPDGSVGARNPDTGDLMVAPTQEEFEECCCPCEPCTDAQEADEAEVTIVGECANPACRNAEGTYVWDSWWVGGAWCFWEWTCDRGEGIVDWLDLGFYNPDAPDGFIYAVIAGFNAGGCFQGIPFNVDIRCVDGKIVGSFDIPCEALEHCEDCHAHVVVGGG